MAQLLEPNAAVEAALGRYGIKVCDDRPPRGHDTSYGPQLADIDYTARSIIRNVMGSYRPTPEDLLYEGAHLIFEPPPPDRYDGAEVHGLLQFEWVLARTIAATIVPGARREFMKRVRDYQDGTQLMDGYTKTRTGQGRWVCIDVGDWPHARDSRWWARGWRLARSLGLLDKLGKVTWKGPTWTPKLLAKWEGGTQFTEAELKKVRL